MKINLRTVLTIMAIVSLAHIGAAQTQLSMPLNGNAHWITDAGIKKYQADTNLNFEMIIYPDGTLDLHGPIYVRSRDGNLIASFQLQLNGVKNGNKLVFDTGTANVLEVDPSVPDLSVGDELFAPGWDGTLTTNRIKLDGDIYRESPYLDILIAIGGEYFIPQT